MAIDKNLMNTMLHQINADMFEYCEPQTLAAYLRDTLLALIKEGENFSGKRPLGDSQWSFYIVNHLYQWHVISGVKDEGGYVEVNDWAVFDDVLGQIVEHMCMEKQTILEDDEHLKFIMSSDEDDKKNMREKEE